MCNIKPYGNTDHLPLPHGEDLTPCVACRYEEAKAMLIDRLNSYSDLFGARIPRDGFYAAKTSAEVCSCAANIHMHHVRMMV